MLADSRFWRSSAASGVSCRCSRIGLSFSSSITALRADLASPSSFLAAVIASLSTVVASSRPDSAFSASVTRCCALSSRSFTLALPLGLMFRTLQTLRASCQSPIQTNIRGPRALALGRPRHGERHGPLGSCTRLPSCAGDSRNRVSLGCSRHTGPAMLQRCLVVHFQPSGPSAACTAPAVALQDSTPR